MQHYVDHRWEFITEKTMELQVQNRTGSNLQMLFSFFFFLSLFFAASVLHSLNKHMGGVCQIRISFIGQVGLGIKGI